MAKKIQETPTNLTREELSNLSRVTTDVFFFSLFCYVIHPVRGKVRFELYPYQKAVLYQFILQRFNILLKFRQAGITELISMYCLWLASYHPNKKINIISIKDTTAKKVLKKIKFMYKNLPWYMQTPIINGRTGEFGSASMIEFDNGSFIESIPTSSEAGRSESLSLRIAYRGGFHRGKTSHGRPGRAVSHGSGIPSVPCPYPRYHGKDRGSGRRYPENCR